MLSFRSIFAAVIYGADGKQVMRSHSLDVNNHECLSRVDTISMSGKHFHLCWERHNNYIKISGVNHPPSGLPPLTINLWPAVLIS